MLHFTLGFDEQKGTLRYILNSFVMKQQLFISTPYSSWHHHFSSRMVDLEIKL